MAPHATERLLVLLCGINVGGRHIVSMAALRELFAELGCADVATYIQSGNLVCTAPAKLTADAIAAALQARFGFAVPVTLRTMSELNAAVTANPFAAGSEVSDLATLHVVFLNGPLSPKELHALEARGVDGERLAACGRELFLHLPYGGGRSKLALACTASSMPGSPTARNWKTVLQLAAMMKS